MFREVMFTGPTMIAMIVITTIICSMANKINVYS